MEYENIMDSKVSFPVTVAGVDLLDAALKNMSLAEKEAAVEKFLDSLGNETEAPMQNVVSMPWRSPNAMDHSVMGERRQTVQQLRKVIDSHGMQHLYESFAQKTMGKYDTSGFGSGPMDVPLNQLFCAGSTGHPSSPLPCNQKATHHCANCMLIKYCSRDCQRKHWAQHKLECQEPFNSKDWKPGYVVEGRPPSFFGGPSSAPFHNGRVDFLWGNTPAMDLFQFSETESESLSLSVLFAASGDLRNFFTSFAGLPQDLSRLLECSSMIGRPRLLPGTL